MAVKLLRIHEEISEASEALRDYDAVAFVEEIADIMIRCFDILGTMGVRVEEALLTKMARNEHRPIKHGRQSAL